MDKNIDVYNFPAKVSHLIKPLDKIFAPLKLKIGQKKQEAMSLQQKHICKGKIPVITQFAIGALDCNVIINAFSKIGIYPFSRQTITEDLLVGDQTKHVKTSDISNTQYSDFDNVARPTSALQIYNENDNEIGGVIDININNSKFTQTDPIKSLPCPECIHNEVTLHPAVAAGIVDIEMASIFLQDGTNKSQSDPQKRGASRDCSKGRCITRALKLERLRQKEKEETNKLDKKKKRLEE